MKNVAVGAKTNNLAEMMAVYVLTDTLARWTTFSISLMLRSHLRWTLVAGLHHGTTLRGEELFLAEKNIWNWWVIVLGRPFHVLAAGCCWRSHTNGSDPLKRTLNRTNWRDFQPGSTRVIWPLIHCLMQGRTTPSHLELTWIYKSNIEQASCHVAPLNCSCIKVSS